MKGILRSKLAIILVTVVLLASAIAIPLISSITHSHATAAKSTIGTEPTWALPFPTGNKMYIGSYGLHDHNFYAVTDDTSHIQYTFTNSGHGNPTDPNAQTALDMLPTNATTPVTSLANGTVLAVQKTCHVVIIDHGNGWWTTYVHIIPSSTLKYGDTVNANTPIGVPNVKQRLACGEQSNAPHVHLALMNATGSTTGTYITLRNHVLCGATVIEQNNNLKNIILQGLTTKKNQIFTIPTCSSPAHNGNLWVTGHDADYHCAVENNQCNYLKVAVNYVMNGSTLPVLALDHGTEVATAITNAFGSSAPVVDTVDPRTGFASLALVDSSGNPLYSAIIIASDITCGGCDNNDGFGATPDSDAINARPLPFIQFYSGGGGILALAGAANYSVFYNFLPVAATGTTTTGPYTFTSVGLSLGLIEGQDDNCCATHNSFQLPATGSPFQIAETDSAGLPETMIASGGSGSSIHNWQRPPHSGQRPSVPRNK